MNRDSAGTQHRTKTSLWECWGSCSLLHPSILQEADVKQDPFLLCMDKVRTTAKYNTQPHHVQDSDRLGGRGQGNHSHYLNNKEQQLEIAAVPTSPMEPCRPRKSPGPSFWPRKSLGPSFFRVASDFV